MTRIQHPGQARPSLLRNWLSLTGLVIVIGSLFSFFLLFVLDTLAHFSNPYVGILTYFVAPGFLIFGLLLTVVGRVAGAAEAGQVRRACCRRWSWTFPGLATGA